jgi:Flp pilus assembly protein TadG
MAPDLYFLVPNSVRPAIRSGCDLALRLARESRAVSAIEFAMIAPVLIFFIIETMQIGLFFYTSAALNQATSYAARQIRVGNVQNGNMTFPQFQALFCQNLPATMPCPTNLIVNVYDVAEGPFGQGFNAFLDPTQTTIAQPVPMSSNTFCPGSPAATAASSNDSGIYVPPVPSGIYIQVYYAMPLFSPIWLAIAAQNGQTWGGKSVHFVAASAAFKNEPYALTPNTQATC